MIEIISHRAQWRGEYETLAGLLRAKLGDSMVSIHHIGSTAVPGLAAKDVIDLQLTVANLEDYPREAIAAAGFELGRPTKDHCPPGLVLPPRELAKRFYNFRNRAANLHVREAGRFNQRYPLLCRDYLRAHEAAAAAYGEIKRQLAKRFPDDANAYYAIKDPVTDILMIGATGWALATNWREPPSD
jgi:GrpB-like predicted nucleotidyltransferase (UPF0157 family)